jgi:hypothetical protein
VPYFLAPLWDVEIAARKEAEQKRRTARIRANAGLSNTKDEAVGYVPRELRQKLKRAKGARQLLRDLEEEVRRFVVSWEDKQKRLTDVGLQDADSDEDEIVFVGRNGQMHDMPPSPKADRVDPEFEMIQREKLVLDALLDDQGARFGYASALSHLSLLTFLVAGSYIPLQHTMDSTLGLSLWVNQQEEKHMLESSH